MIEKRPGFQPSHALRVWNISGRVFGTSRPDPTANAGDRADWVVAASGPGYLPDLRGRSVSLVVAAICDELYDPRRSW